MASVEYALEGETDEQFVARLGADAFGEGNKEEVGEGERRERTSSTSASRLDPGPTVKEECCTAIA